MQRDEFAELTSVALAQGTSFARPAGLTDPLRLDSPATRVMTELDVSKAITAGPDVSVDDALVTMINKGVRLLFVVDDERTIVGLVTATDIQGEKPIKIVQQTRRPRSRIKLREVMTPQTQITALSLATVKNAQVGHIVSTLHRQGRQHALVVDVEPSGKQVVCGLFSSTQISKRLGVEPEETVPSARSLAEIVSRTG